MAWNPDHYLAFGDHRLRPAIDLLDKVALATPAAIHDLGCGAGNVTRLLAQRWPGAAITAIDNSPDMLARARQQRLDVAWDRSRYRGLRPGAPRRPRLLECRAAVARRSPASPSPPARHGGAGRCPGGTDAAQSRDTVSDADRGSGACRSVARDACACPAPSGRRRAGVLSRIAGTRGGATLFGRPSIFTSWRARTRWWPGHPARRFGRFSIRSPRANARAFSPSTRRASATPTRRSRTGKPCSRSAACSSSPHARASAEQGDFI